MLIDSIDQLFDYSVSISCDKKKRALQDIVFKYAGLPPTKTINAITPSNLTDKNAQTDLMRRFSSFMSDKTDVQAILAAPKTELWRYLSLSTKMAVFDAKEKNLPYVFVFEDDAWPQRDLAVKLPEYISEINKIDCEVGAGLYMVGYNKSYDTYWRLAEKRYNGFDYFTNTARFIGSQSYIVPARSYDFVLNIDPMPSDWMLGKIPAKAISRGDSIWFIQSQHEGWRETRSISAASNHAHSYIWWRKYYEEPFDKNVISFDELGIPTTYDEYIKASNMNFPVLYCIETKNDTVGVLYKTQLQKSVAQLLKQADIRGIDLDVYVMSKCSEDCPDGCLWIDATEIDSLCRRVLPQVGKWSYTIWWRLFAAWIPRFKDVKRLLYLDTDTWCISPYFFDIFDVNISIKHDCVGVRDIVVKDKRSAQLLDLYNDSICDQQKSNLKKSLYVNSGVLVMNLPAIRKNFNTMNQLAANIMAIHAMHPLQFPDQDAINTLFKVKSIPYRYNTLVNKMSTKDDFQKFMLHFTGNIRRRQQYRNEFPDWRINRFKDYIND